LEDSADYGAAEREAKRALELDPTLDTARAILANIHALRGQFVAAERCHRDMVRGSSIEGSFYANHGAIVLGGCGHLEEALQTVRQGYALSPATPAVVALLALVHSDLALDREAEEYAERCVALGYDGAPIAAVVRAASARRAGQFTEAARWALECLPAAARSVAAIRALEASYAAVSGQAPRRAALEALEHLRAEQAPMPMLCLQMLHCYAMLGEIECAHDVADVWVSNRLEKGIVGIYWDQIWVPELQAFRCHRRFLELARRLGMTDYWRQFGPPDDAAVAAMISHCA
jgi:Tfp pilus assembly protein PilF